MENKDTQEHVCSISPTQFEEYCLKILNGYAEEEKLTEFAITHNVVISATDGEYQIDVYAEFTAMGVKFKVLCECKRYSHPVSREKVAVLHDKIASIGAHKGILLSTSGFQSGAIQYAKTHGIALIHVYDHRIEHLTHSSDGSQNIEDDPFLYAERNRPPYDAFDCTSETEEPRMIYPTTSMMKRLLLEEKKLIKEKLGIDIDCPDI